MLQTHRELIPLDIPGRPELLTLEDHELIERYRDLQSGVRVTADVRRQLEFLGTWRVRVWALESKNAFRITSLLDSAMVFRREAAMIEADHEPPDPELIDHAVALERHTREAFAIDIATAPNTGSFFDMRDWAQQAAKRFDRCPIWLRTMQMPRNGVPFHKPHGERDQGPKTESFTW